MTEPRRAQPWKQTRRGPDERTAYVKKHPKFEVYRRRDGAFDWRLKAGNGQIIATSHNQGFGSVKDALRSVAAVKNAAFDAATVVVVVEVKR